MSDDTLEREATAGQDELEGAMLRGGSFVDAFGSKKDRGLMRRLPTMLRRGHSTLIPRLKEGEDEPLLVVFDLDETIVYARDGPLMLRPHAKELLLALEGMCEIAFWTAGVRDYAKAIVAEIEKTVWGRTPAGVIKHCISRNASWFDAEDYTKDLRKLGRDLGKVLIIENTPDCVRLNPENAIIVEDFEGVKDQTFTLRALSDVILELINSGKPVQEFIPGCPHLEKQEVGGQQVYYLAAGKAGAKKQLKVNKDKAPAKQAGQKRQRSDSPPSAVTEGESDTEEETEGESSEDETEEESPPPKKKPAKKGAKKAAAKKAAKKAAAKKK